MKKNSHEIVESLGRIIYLLGKINFSKTYKILGVPASIRQ